MSILNSIGTTIVRIISGASLETAYLAQEQRFRDALQIQANQHDICRHGSLENARQWKQRGNKAQKEKNFSRDAHGRQIANWYSESHNYNEHGIATSCKVV